MPDDPIKDSPPREPGPDDNWFMRGYLNWAASWQRFKNKSRPDAVWAYYNDLPEWQQAAVVFGAIFLLFGGYYVVRATAELSDPMGSPQVLNIIEAPPLEEAQAAAQKSYDSALGNLENEKYENALDLLQNVPDDFEDTKELKAELRTKAKEQKDEVRYEPTYQAALTAIAEENYPEAIEQLQRITANGMPYAYRDTQDLIEQVIGLSREADLAVATKAGDEYDELQLEQRERQALRVYNLAFIRNSAVISDQIYRARELLISITNGWRGPTEGITPIDSALDAVDEAIGDLKEYAAPTPIDDLHDDYMAVVEGLRAKLSSTKNSLSPYAKSVVKTRISELDALNDRSTNTRSDLVAQMDKIDLDAVDGDILSNAEVDLNLRNER